MAAGHASYSLRIGTIARDGDQDHATLVRAQERDALAIVTDVPSTQRADKGPGKSAQRRNLP